MDWDGVSRLVEWLIDEGMHGLVIAGTAGEWFTLSEAERHELFSAAAAAAAGRTTLLAGCSAFTAAEVIRHADAAVAADFDGIVVTPPPYARPNDKELIAFYRTIGDAAALPLCVYNWPRGTGIDMSVELQRRLAELDAVVAIKNSTERFDRFLAGFFALREEVQYFGVPMTELGFTLVTEYGAPGMIGAGGILGRRQPDFFNHAWAGDRAAALACGALDQELARRWRTGFEPRFGSGAANMKAALDLMGLPGGPPRPPLLPLDAAETEQVRRILVDLGALGGDA